MKYASSLQNPAPGEYEALTNAMHTHTPACAGDERFTTEDPKLDALKTICDTCQVFTECHVYAVAARPKAGIWAGRRWQQTTP